MKPKLKVFRILFISFLVIYASYTLIYQQAEYNKYRLMRDSYKEQINLAMAKKEDYKSYSEYVRTDKYIEQIAREKLGMVLPEEKIYIDITN